jgi:hypothetical protein
MYAIRKSLAGVEEPLQMHLVHRQKPRPARPLVMIGSGDSGRNEVKNLNYLVRPYALKKARTTSAAMPRGIVAADFFLPMTIYQ